MKGFLLLLFSVLSHAAVVPLEWDPPDTVDVVSHYNIKEKFSGEWAKIAESTFSQIDLQDVMPGVHFYTVSASYAEGESDNSNELSVSFVTVIVESGNNMADWTERHRIEEVWEQRKFYRIRFEDQP